MTQNVCTLHISARIALSPAFPAKASIAIAHPLVLRSKPPQSDSAAVLERLKSDTMATVQQVAQQLPAAGPANGKGDKNGNIAGPGGSPQQSPSGPVQHRRVYQACIPCRKRKVKCDLGPVDNPRPGPCVRCLRESKACYFSDTRRKQKLDENDEPIYDPDFVDRNARKRTISDRGSEAPEIRTLGPYRDTPLAPVTPSGRIQHYNALPLSRPGQTSRSGSWQQPQQDDDSGRVMTNPEAQSAMRTEIFSNHDAMNLLLKAATDP